MRTHPFLHDDKQRPEAHSGPGAGNRGQGITVLGGLMLIGTLLWSLAGTLVFGVLCLGGIEMLFHPNRDGLGLLLVPFLLASIPGTWCFGKQLLMALAVTFNSFRR